MFRFFFITPLVGFVLLSGMFSYTIQAFAVEDYDNVFISEVWAGNSNFENNCTNKVYKTSNPVGLCKIDFWIELTNPTNSPINLNGYSFDFTANKTSSLNDECTTTSNKAKPLYCIGSPIDKQNPNLVIPANSQIVFKEKYGDSVNEGVMFVSMVNDLGLSNVYPMVLTYPQSVSKSSFSFGLYDVSGRLIDSYSRALNSNNSSSQFCIIDGQKILTMGKSDLVIREKTFKMTPGKANNCELVNPIIKPVKPVEITLVPVKEAVIVTIPVVDKIVESAPKNEKIEVMNDPIRELDVTQNLQTQKPATAINDLEKVDLINQNSKNEILQETFIKKDTTLDLDTNNQKNTDKAVDSKEILIQKDTSSLALEKEIKPVVNPDFFSNLSDNFSLNSILPILNTKSEKIVENILQTSNKDIPKEKNVNTQDLSFNAEPKIENNLSQPDKPIEVILQPQINTIDDQAVPRESKLEKIDTNVKDLNTEGFAKYIEPAIENKVQNKVENDIKNLNISEKEILIKSTIVLPDQAQSNYFAQENIIKPVVEKPVVEQKLDLGFAKNHQVNTININKVDYNSYDSNKFSQEIKSPTQTINTELKTIITDKKNNQLNENVLDKAISKNPVSNILKKSNNPQAELKSNLGQIKLIQVIDTDKPKLNNALVTKTVSVDMHNIKTMFLFVDVLIIVFLGTRTIALNRDYLFKIYQLARKNIIN